MVKIFKYKVSLGDCLFWVVKLTTNANPDKYGYSGNGIGLDSHWQFPLSSGEWSKNVVIFAVDDNFSAHADNNKKIDYMMLQ